MIRVLAIALVLGGLVSNEAVLAFLFAPDGQLSAPTRWRVRAFQAALLFLAVLVFVFRKPLQARAIACARRFPNLAAAAFGLAAVAALFILTELGFHAWNTIGERLGPKTVVSYSEPLWQPGVTCRSQKRIGERVVYDVTYTMDADGHRVVPASRGRNGGRHLVFFGGSYTFGQGVNDADTFPNAVAQRLPDWRVTNFGYPGHGPAHMLERLEDPSTFDDLRGTETILVYTFIPNHVRRVIGSMRVATAWGRQSPYYALSPDGTLTRNGIVGSGRARLSSIYGWLAKEPVLKFFDIDLPVRITERHLEHTAAVIAASRDRFLETAEHRRFYVLIYPDRPEAEFSGTRIVPHLERQGIPCFNYAARLDGDGDYWIGDDTHPTAEAHAMIGRWLAEDLRRKMNVGNGGEATLPATGSS